MPWLFLAPLGSKLPEKKLKREYESRRRMIGGGIKTSTCIGIPNDSWARRKIWE
jgi:hypothetical protein